MSAVRERLPMWQNVLIDTQAAHAEALADALFEFGALSTAIEDAQAGTNAEQPIFGEPGEPEPGVWQMSRVVALFDVDVDAPARVAEACAALGIERPQLRCETIDEQDWVRVTQAQFDPIAINERLWIVPTWHEAPMDVPVVLRLDPGLAFGTGSHPTTRLCLEWLAHHIHGGERVLDYGCGSGILALAAAKLGAASVVGVDIDAQAVQSSLDNAAQNGVTMACYTVDRFVPQPAQIVLANILANPLRVLAPALAALVEPGGTLVLSGILAEQAEELMACYAAWFSFEPPAFAEGWTRLVGQRCAEPS